LVRLADEQILQRHRQRHRQRQRPASTTSDQHHAGDLPGVAAGLVTLRDDSVDAPSHVPGGVLGAVGQRGDRDATVMRAGDHVVRRRAERVGDERDRMRERRVDLGAFHELGRDLMKLNDIAVWDAPAQATADAIDQAMTELFAGVTMAPAKYTRSGLAVAQA